MKRTFLAKRNGLLSPTNISWGALALVLAVLVLCVRLLAPNFFWYMFTPVFRTADALAAKNHVFFLSFRDTAVLAVQNEKLASENTVLANENQALTEKISEFSALLGTPAAQGILVGVVARPPTSPYDTLVLSEGGEAGITLGMEAFGEGNVPLGMVSSVLTRFSRVTLFSAPGMTTSGWIGHMNIPLTLLGAGGGALHASIARSAGVAVGDTVFIPGPGALPMGKVVRIDDDPSSPEVTLRIQPILNLFSTTWVLVRDIGAALL